MFYADIRRKVDRRNWPETSKCCSVERPFKRPGDVQHGHRAEGRPNTYAQNAKVWIRKRISGGSGTASIQEHCWTASLAKQLVRGRHPREEGAAHIGSDPPSRNIAQEDGMSPERVQ